jgi:spermidine/putrescine-binding protein
VEEDGRRPQGLGDQETNQRQREEPDELQVFDWAGYGDGSSYPGHERKDLWEAYARATGDTPTFMLFEVNAAGLAKLSGGTTFDVVHPTSSYFPDCLDLGVVQPWDTTLIRNYDRLLPSLERVGAIDGKQYFIVEDWGFLAPLHRADRVTPTERSCSPLFDDRYEGRISWQAPSIWSPSPRSSTDSRTHGT